jgi:cytochrome c-type biogenesis protein CcmE
MNLRLAVTMACYAVLAVIAILALDGFLRSVVLFFFAILAVKTIAHSKDEEMK